MVADVARILFETGCNIEDSSMTRLGGQFTIMLMLSYPESLTVEQLEERLKPVVDRLDLHHLLVPIPGHEAEEGDEENESYTINVMGADRPGIVYHTTQLLAEKQVNITDMLTHTAGAEGRPIYVMNIEVEQVANPDTLRKELKELASRLHVEISMRADDVFEL
uniref:Putative amino acid-binding ACT domain protein n=1 Tax=Magnetococcus massalia (strain MO-1) TaxID=451514 RepID=A0A1S7LP79_MAGMO|nr:Putative amino acid-binding ACT domain protein [Candidatus Magnetococcus massalia]